MIRIPQSKKENTKSKKAKSSANSATESEEQINNKIVGASDVTGETSLIVGQQVEVLQNGNWAAGSIIAIPRNQPPQYTVRLDSEAVVDEIAPDAIRPRKEDLVSDEDSDDDTSLSEEESDSSNSEEIVTGRSAADVVSNPGDQVGRDEILKAAANAKITDVHKDAGGVDDTHGGDEHHKDAGNGDDADGHNADQEDVAHAHGTTVAKSTTVRETPAEVNDKADVAAESTSIKNTALADDQKAVQKPTGDAGGAKETTTAILSKGSQVEVCMSKDASAAASWELGQVVARHSKPPLAHSSRKGRSKTPPITFDVKIVSSGKTLLKIASNRVRAVSVKNKDNGISTTTSTVDGLKKAQLSFGAVVEVQRMIKQNKIENNEGSDAETPAREKEDLTDEKSKSKVTKTGKAAETNDDKAGEKNKSKANDKEIKSESSVTDRGRVVRATSDGKWLDIVMYDCSLRCRVPREQACKSTNCGFA